MSLFGLNKGTPFMADFIIITHICVFISSAHKHFECSLFIDVANDPVNIKP